MLNSLICIVYFYSKKPVEFNQYGSLCYPYEKTKSQIVYFDFKYLLYQKIK